jgi:hypothetical protein
MEQNDERTEARRYMGPGDPRQDVRRTHPAGMAEDVNAMRAQTIARRRQTWPYIALTCDDSGVTWLNVVLCLAPLAPNWPSEIPSALLVCIRFLMEPLVARRAQAALDLCDPAVGHR